MIGAYKSLTALGRHHRSGKMSHGYLPKFDQWLAPFREEAFTLLEIGVFEGASIRMWHDYFPNALIVGVDIKPAGFPLDRFIFAQGNQNDAEFLAALVAEHDPYVVIDDGSHRWAHQILTFRTIFPHMRSGGIYICEGLLTSFGELRARYGAEGEPSAADMFLNLAAPVMEGGTDFDDPVGDLISGMSFIRHAVMMERA